jgi:hypothetical protein
MLRIRVLLTAVLAAVLVSAPAQAATIFVATLTHSQETMQGQLVTDTGDPRPLSFGSATFVLNDAMTELSMTRRSSTSTSTARRPLTRTTTSTPLTSTWARRLDRTHWCDGASSGCRTTTTIQTTWS